MAIRACGAILENDGEVAVFIPLRIHGGAAYMLKDYSHAQTQKRVGMTPEEFRAQYPLMDGAEEKKAEMLATLEITQEELNDALCIARSDVAESRNLLSSFVPVGRNAS